jgi:hypothetical protein
MITVLDFNAMPIKEQADIAITGNFLGDRREGKLIVQLHRLDNFYVELFYDPVKNEIVRYEGLPIPTGWRLISGLISYWCC